MSDQRLPLAFAASPDINQIDPQRTALVLTDGAASSRFAVVRHADSAAAAQAGTCSCCRVPSDLVAVLRRLVIDRARGDIDVATVLVVGKAADLPQLEQDALADPFVAARYTVAHAR